MIHGYKELYLSPEKFGSCVEDRLFSAASFLAGISFDEVAEPFAQRCSLQFLNIQSDEEMDTWYLQPMQILTAQGNVLSSREGHEEIGTYLRQEIGIECEFCQYEDTVSMEEVGKRMCAGQIPVLMVDLGKWREDPKYGKGRAAHAFMLKEYCSDTKIWQIAGLKGERHREIKEETLQEIAENVCFYIRKEPVQHKAHINGNEPQTTGGRSTSETMIQTFLRYLERELGREYMQKRFAEPCFYSIHYKIIPMIRYEHRLTGNEKARLLKEWRLLASYLQMGKNGNAKEQIKIIEEYFRHMKGECE